MPITVSPITPSFAAEIGDVDLTKPLLVAVEFSGRVGTSLTAILGAHRLPCRF